MEGVVFNSIAKSYIEKTTGQKTSPALYVASATMAGLVLATAFRDKHGGKFIEIANVVKVFGDNHTKEFGRGYAVVCNVPSSNILTCNDFYAEIYVHTASRDNEESYTNLDSKVFLGQIETLCKERYRDMIRHPERYLRSEFDECLCELDGMEQLILALYGAVPLVRDAATLLLNYCYDLNDGKDYSKDRGDVH